MLIFSVTSHSNLIFRGPREETFTQQSFQPILDVYNYTQQKAAWLKGVQMTNCLKVKRTRLFWEVILLIWKNIVAFFPCFSKSKRDCECRCVEGKKVDEADLAPLLMCLKGRPGKAGLIWWHCKVDLLTLPNKYTLFIFNLFPWQKSLLWSNPYFFVSPNKGEEA